MRRIVVTGVGMVTPLGRGGEINWKRMLKGESGVDYISLFNASRFPTKIAGEVRNLDFSAWEKKDARLKHAGRNSRFAIVAAEEAINDSGLRDGSKLGERIGIYMGAGDGGSDFANFTRAVLDSISKDPSHGVVDKDFYLSNTASYFNSYVEFEQEPCVVAGHLARLFDIMGPCFNCLTACAASSQAIGEALHVIRRGDADVMIAGGSHSMIHPFGVAGFNLLTALSTHNEEPQKASRPFDMRRDGFILAEGAGVVVLEELEHAKKRGAKIYGELIGYGSSADAYRMTDTHPEGRGAIQAIALALKDAKVNLNEVGYINAHGTSTSVNDEIETRAIKEVFGAQAKNIPVSSIKSMMGHLIAAAGAVELITCLYVIQHGMIPPTINYEVQDPKCDLDYVPNVAREKKVDVAMSNSFGFGGQNVTLVAKRFSG
jgi:3-oxoacyl-[acyl-carrier-protein] synthase II